MNALIFLAAFASFSQEIMATRIDVIVPDGPTAAADADAVFAAFRDVEATMNEWRDGSPLAAVNRGAGTPVAAPADLRALVRRACDVAALTDGAFDPTWAALWGLWDFRGMGEPRVPDPALARARAALVDYRRVVVDDTHGTITLGRGQVMGLGGIAKGRALDRAASALRARGVHDFLLSAGGQVMAGGTHDGRPWRVGIRDPRGPADDFFALFEARDVSVSTSGDYEHFFVKDGTLYHHILDPRTGFPARGVRSVTVVAADATLADGLSTGLFVLGPERGRAVLAKLPGVEALWVDDHGAVHVTPGLDARLTRVHPPRP
jgi:thiamine biosynthesis lipoprotein